MKDEVMKKNKSRKYTNRNSCTSLGHPNREVFNSTENKGKSCFICKDCRKYLGVVHSLDNEDKFGDKLT